MASCVVRNRTMGGQAQTATNSLLTTTQMLLLPALLAYAAITTSAVALVLREQQRRKRSGSTSTITRLPEMSPATHARDDVLSQLRNRSRSHGTYSEGSTLNSGPGANV